MTPEIEHQFRLNILAKCASHVGDEEKPRFSNTDHGGFIDRANAYVGNAHAHAAWCLASHCYIVFAVAESMGLTFGDTKLLKAGFCPDEANHAIKIGTAVTPHDILTGKATVRPGDLCLFWYDGEHGYHHAATLKTVPSPGHPAFIVYAGNTVPENAPAVPGHEREGYGYYERHYRADAVEPSGHPHFLFVRTV